MIKYLGSKRKLLPAIVAAVKAFPDARTALDLFSGTARVGHALKDAGLFVTANDHLAYAATLGRCYVEADRDAVHDEARRVLDHLATVTPRAGWFTDTYCVRSRFFQPENGARIEAMREELVTLALDPTLESVVLVSLMEAADRVDSTTGVQMAYLKAWAKRSSNPLELRMPRVLPGKGRSIMREAVDAAREVRADVAYLDPPYNQHRYVGNYHIWETLVRWDEPEVFGVAQKRVQCRDVKSPFNLKRGIHTALSDVVKALDVEHLVVSFSDEGYVARDEMRALLETRGHVEIVEVDFPRYVGARIGIHNPKGERVGEVSHLRNTEYLFVVSPLPLLARAAKVAAEQAIAAGDRKGGPDLLRVRS